jgi:hypothetical protein
MKINLQNKLHGTLRIINFVFIVRKECTMRLIDADKLFEQVEEIYKSANTTERQAYSRVLDIISAAQDIDATTAGQRLLLKNDRGNTIATIDIHDGCIVNAQSGQFFIDDVDGARIYDRDYTVYRIVIPTQDDVLEDVSNATLLEALSLRLKGN